MCEFGILEWATSFFLLGGGPALLLKAEGEQGLANGWFELGPLQVFFADRLKKLFRPRDMPMAIVQAARRDS
jgi:hypothetical protein